MVLASPTPVKTKPFVELISREKFPSTDCFKISNSKQIFYRNIPMRMGVTFSINQLETAKSYTEKAFLLRGIYAFLVVYQLGEMVTVFYQTSPPKKSKIAAYLTEQQKRPKKDLNINQSFPQTSRKYRGRTY